MTDPEKKDPAPDPGVSGSVLPTQVKNEKFSFSWPLNESIFCEEQTECDIESPKFSSEGNDQLKWCIRASVKRLDEKKMDLYSLYLILMDCVEGEVWAQFKFSLLNAKKENLKERETYKAYRFFQGKLWGFSQFAVKDLLMDEANKLSVLCEVNIVGDSQDSSG
ncbi:hypothetical protein RRG08_043688 [Elysia crispata]|uniref:MATH domain-containing protein n=1 Tax=Elysia crispata TaxID=231223 RepID=A0AAE0ZNK2_9GAST|nr:hypothetical protein RRG08_043688 [Elysia crispata]